MIEVNSLFQVNFGSQFKKRKFVEEVMMTIQDTEQKDGLPCPKWFALYLVFKNYNVNNLKNQVTEDDKDFKTMEFWRESLEITGRAKQFIIDRKLDNYPRIKNQLKDIGLTLGISFRDSYEKLIADIEKLYEEAGSK